MIASVDFVSAVQYMIHFIYRFVRLNTEELRIRTGGRRAGSLITIVVEQLNEGLLNYA